jgi:hypothetical protein
MAMAKAGANTSQGGAEATWELAGPSAEEQALATSRDVELAMELVVQEALQKGVDREVVMAAQEIGEASPATEVKTPVAGKGKAKVGKPSDLEADLEAGLAWECKLAKKAWRGASQVASVTLQAHQLKQTKMVKAAVAHTQAMACFADGRPLVSPSQRSQVDGSPERADNTKKAVQVMTAKGLVAPQWVLLIGGSFYSMVGAKLKAQLGLSEGDMDAGGHRVHTATGKIEMLQGGLTKRPVPIVLNAGTPEELTLYEKLAVTDSKGYDLLVGTKAAYPSGLSVVHWAEQALYRADWNGAGAVVGRLPMRLH